MKIERRKRVVDRPLMVPSPGRARPPSPAKREGFKSRLFRGLGCLVLFMERRAERLLLLQLLGDEEGEFERLRGIEAGIADRVVAVVEVALRYSMDAACAFGDILARHFDMDAARMRAFRLVHGHEPAHLAEHGL